MVSKLRAQTVMEYDRKHWKAAKALIVVIPLLGKYEIMISLKTLMDLNSEPTFRQPEQVLQLYLCSL